LGVLKIVKVADENVAFGEVADGVLGLSYSVGFTSSFVGTVDALVDNLWRFARILWLSPADAIDPASKIVNRTNRPETSWVYAA
jgi:hypothetical protein